ncbi:hypothetical protein [Escherichia phage Skure]|nr:hypothetical protein [Escherichia phage Skure]
MRSGRCRFVFFIGRYAIKIPRLNSYEGFLQGLLSNITERKWRNYPDKHLCPVVYANCIGLIVIMLRAQEVTDFEKFKKDLDVICNDEKGLGEEFYRWDGTAKNFGYLNGKLVKVDYGD